MSTVISEMQPLRSFLSIVVGVGPACGPCAQEVNRSRSTIRLVGVARARVSPEESRARMAGANSHVRFDGIHFFLEKQACLDGGGRGLPEVAACLDGWVAYILRNWSA